MGDEAGDEDDVDRASAEHLVGDVNVSAPRVPGLRHLHGGFPPSGRADGGTNVRVRDDLIGGVYQIPDVALRFALSDSLFYADETGSAGTEMTSFDWASARPHVPAAGTVGATAL